MDPRPIRFLAEAGGGTLLSGSSETFVCRVCTDSRVAQPGDAFFALSGDRFDGHDFAASAAERGATAVVLRHAVAVGQAAPIGAFGSEPSLSGQPKSQAQTSSIQNPSCAVLAVDDPRLALGRVADAYRREMSLPVVGIAGSNGKTSTKELVAAVLRQSLRTLWSEASFNNDIGVPLSLLRLSRTHQVAVLELGTNHPGELEPLVRMVRPDFGVITCIGREHLEFFRNMEGVVREEGMLGEFISPSGRLFISGDSEWTDSIMARTRARVLRVGVGEKNDYRLAAARVEKEGVIFRVDAPHPAFSGEYRIKLLGRHQAINALFAIALGAEFGLSRETIQRGLSECQPAESRMEFQELNGVGVLDDCYNANADSMVAALATLKELPCRGRRVAVLGDMAELGAHSEAAHEEVGRRAAELGVGQLFAIGKMASVLARGARNAGLNRILEFQDIEAAATALRSFVRGGDLLLLKASRATRLERVLQRLRNGQAGKQN